MVNIEAEWKTVLSDYFEKPEFTRLADFVRQEYVSKKVYPCPEDRSEEHTSELQSH